MAIMSEKQIHEMGFKFIGRNVKISNKASFYNLTNISIGNNSRIDDFCILSAGLAGISICKNVHIACYSSLIGKGKITLDDYSNISSRVSIYSSSDDYSGAFMTNPTIPDEYTNIDHRDVLIKKHVIVGSGAVILPGITLHVGAAIGALSLVNKDVPAFSIFSGIPIKKIGDRSRGLLQFEKEIEKRAL